MSDSPDAGADVGADTPEGRLVAEGSFKLDRARAIDKLAHFQLDDPRRYVAELVSSAVCADATGIHIRNDADDFEIEWDGDHPTLDELESLFDTIFYRGEDRRQRMLQHLAQGIFGAAGLDPQWVRLHRPGLTVDLTDPAQPQSTPNDRTEGMRVEVRERMSWAVLREWGRKAFKDPEELLLVKQVAVACPVPIFVGGAALPVGLDRLLGDTPAGAQDIEGLQAGEAGQVWLVERNTAESAGILVVRDGIVVDRIPLIVGPLALCGWVRCDGMTLDASQAGVVRRGRWTEVWKLARASARNAVHQAIVDGVGPPVDAAVLRKAGQAVVSGPTCVLAAVPLFDDLAGVPWSLRELSARSRVLVCGDRELFDAELAVPQLMGGVVVLRRLKSLGIDNVVDGEAELKARVWGRLRRTSLRKTLQPLTVPARVQLRRDVDGMALRGGLGLQRASPDDRPPTKAALHVELRVDGLPVELRTVPGPGPMLVRVESAALEADGAFVEVLAGAALDRAMAEAQRVGDALLERALKDAPFEPEVRKVLWTWVRHHTRGRRRGRIAALPDALRAAPLFLCTDGQRLSIADFPDVAKRNGRLDNKGRTVVWTIPAGAAPPRPVEGVLHLDDGDRTLLNHLLEGRVLDVLPQLRAEAEADRRRTQGSEEAKLFGPMLARATIDAPGLLGEVGLRRGDLSASCVCKVIRDRVLLGEVELPVDLPGSVAAVEWAQARPTDDWSGLADPEGAALALAELLEPHLVALAQVAATAWVADGSTGVASRARGTDRPLPPWLAAVLRRGRDGTSSLGNLPFVRDLGGRVHSLAALGAPLPPGARRSRGPRYLTVPPGTVLPTEIPRDEGGQFDEELGGMLVVDPERAVILEIWLGSGALRSGVPVLDQVRLAWSAFYRKSTHAWEAHPSALGAVHVQKEGVELFVGLDPTRAAPC